MMPTYIRFPTTLQGFRRLEYGFQQSNGLRNICGTVRITSIITNRKYRLKIDGTHFDLKECPRNDNWASFFDRKGEYSVGAVAVCDAYGRFLYFQSGFAGSKHDASVLMLTELYQQFEIQEVRPFPNAILLGDSAYGLHDWLITPYPGNNIPQHERSFNTKHSSTRMSVERGFGFLKNRFPTLLGRCGIRDPTVFSTLTMAAATISNYLLLDRPSNQVLDHDANFAMINHQFADVHIPPVPPNLSRRQKGQFLGRSRRHFMT
jgi:hypothetical protein